VVKINLTRSTELFARTAREMAGAVKGLQVVRTKRVCVSAPACVRQRVGGGRGGEREEERGERERERGCVHMFGILLAGKGFKAYGIKLTNMDMGYCNGSDS